VHYREGKSTCRSGIFLAHVCTIYASSHGCEPNLSIVKRVSSLVGWLMVYVDVAIDDHRHWYCDWKTLRVFHIHLLLENG
jgi:hypothetical protein